MAILSLSLYPRGSAEDVDEQEVRGEDGREVFDAIVRGGRDLAEGRSKIYPQGISMLCLRGWGTQLGMDSGLTSETSLRWVDFDLAKYRAGRSLGCVSRAS